VSALPKGHRGRGAAPNGGSAGRLGYRPELDGLRGIAIILVLCLHAFFWPKGAFVGVDMFFALSGFLITTLLLEEWQVHGSISLRHFYLRRYYRLFPGLVVLIGIYVLVVVLFAHADVAMRLRGAGFGLAYVANWVQALQKPYPGTEIGHLWTLAIEEQFYIVWPTILILMLKRGLGLKGTKWALLGMIVAIVAWRNVLILHGADPRRIFFGTDTRFDQLLVGCLAGTLYVGRRREHGSRWLMVAGVGAGLFLLWRIFQRDPWGFWSLRITLTLIAAATTVVIYSCVTGSFALLRRALSAKWLVFVGVISYSLYLWHVPVYVLLRQVAHLQHWQLTAAEFALSFAAACASFYLVERPFLKRRKAHRTLPSTKGALPGDSVFPRRDDSAPLNAYSRPPPTV
jgi:peptidoglycan/LPS O-acetylase OafA/YrhL